MRSSAWTPSIVPAGGDDETVYLVKDDLGRLGAVWRESDAETTDLETIITDLLEVYAYNMLVTTYAISLTNRRRTTPFPIPLMMMRRRCMPIS